MAKRGENAAKMNMFNKGRENTVPAKKEEITAPEPQNDVKEAQKAAEEKSDTRKEKTSAAEKSKKNATVTPAIDDLFPKKKEKGAPVSIYLDTDVKRFLDECTEKYGRSRSELVNEIIRSYMH